MNVQSVLLSVWLQREKEILQKPEQTTVNLHTLLITLSNMKGMRQPPVWKIIIVCVCV